MGHYLPGWGKMHRILSSYNHKLYKVFNEEREVFFCRRTVTYYWKHIQCHKKKISEGLQHIFKNYGMECMKHCHYSVSGEDYWSRFKCNKINCWMIQPKKKYYYQKYMCFKNTGVLCHWSLRWDEKFHWIYMIMLSVLVKYDK